jgi:hypothetical protein
MNTKQTITTMLVASCMVLLTAHKSCDAQVVTEDPPLITQIGAEITTMSSELQQVTAIAGTVSSVLNVQNDISNALGVIGSDIDDLGGGTVGQLIGSAEMGFSAVKSAQGSVEQIVQDVHNLQNDPLSSMSILTQLTAIGENQAAQIMSTDPAISDQVNDMNNILSGEDSISQANTAIDNDLFVATTSPDSGTIEDVNATRRAVIENAAITGMTAAASASQSVSNDGQTALASLSSGVTGSTDERGDIKANSAIVLKIAEQLSAQNQILGHLLYLESSTTIGNEGVYGPAAGQAVTPIEGTTP